MLDYIFTLHTPPASRPPPPTPRNSCNSVLHHLETKDTNDGEKEDGGRGGERNFKLMAVLIYGSNIWSVLDPGLFVLFVVWCVHSTTGVPVWSYAVPAL